MVLGKIKKLIFLFFALSATICTSQREAPYLPSSINPRASYCFYLYGGVVTVLGDMAINAPLEIETDSKLILFSL
jgi:hypothetical protein